VSLSTEAQRRQICRLPIGDSSVTTSDRYAIAGTYEIATSASFWSEDLRRQIARCLPVADASIGEADRYNLAHTYRSEVSTGATIEIFDVTWQLEPNWSASLLPVSNEGIIATALDAAVSGFVGGYAPVVPPNIAAPTLPPKSLETRRMKRRARGLDTIYMGEHNKDRRTR